MGKIKVSYNKTLKLNNILVYKVPIEEDDFDLNVAVSQIISYIKSKGALQVGPLIQCTTSQVNEEKKMEVEIVLMLQCNHLIHKVETPYYMNPLLCIRNCMYSRYVGLENNLNFVYDKIKLEAFENDITVNEQWYTVFVDNNEESDTVVVDVFVERIN